LNWVRADNLPLPREHNIRDGILTIYNVDKDAAGEYSCVGMKQGREVFRASAILEVTGMLLF
jgi:hypothetical protein